MLRCALLACLLLLALPVSAGADSYRSRYAGHPVRIAAYLLHPVGVVLDRAIFRPAWALGQHEPIRTLFGVEREVKSEAAPVTTNPFLEPYREEP